jgi:hypothetical protein
VFIIAEKTRSRGKEVRILQVVKLLLAVGSKALKLAKHEIYLLAVLLAFLTSLLAVLLTITLTKADH